MEDFLGSFIGSAARAKLLRVFALNQQPLTLTQVAKRAGISTRVAEVEIKMLAKWGVVKKTKFTIAIKKGTQHVVAGTQKELAWTFDQSFRHAAAVARFVREVSPIAHKEIISGLRRTGRVSAVVLSGAFVGDLSRPADIIIAGDGVSERKLEAAMRTLEPQLGREIRYATFTTPEFRYRMTIQDRLLRDTLDFPHVVLLDKTRLL